MVRIISLNVRGLANGRKRRIIFDKCRKRGDIIALQETHSTPEIESVWIHEWGGKIVFAHGASNARGVCLLIQKGIDCRILRQVPDKEGRFLIIELKVEEKILTITNIYAPNKDTPAYFEGLFDILKNFDEAKILIGDFNLTLNNQLDRLNTYSNNDRSRDTLLDLMNENFLEDIWRIRNNEKKEYSWIKKQARSSNISQHDQKASRIDLAITSQGLEIENVMYFPATFTDHRALFLSVKCFKGKERGPGYWKFNTTLLNNPDFVEFMNKALDQFESKEQSAVGRWAHLKKYIKSRTQKFTRKQKREETLIISQLMEQIQELQSNLPLSKENYKILDDSILDLEEIQQKHVEGIIFRSKAKWQLEGEKNTKYFYSLEKSKIQC